MRTTERNYTTATKLSRIALLSKDDPSREFHQLMHHFNEASLLECAQELGGKKAVGVDGINKDQYMETAGKRIKELVERMKRMSYRPSPAREVKIPKEDKRNAFRKLGISNVEDKIVQKMMQKVLESVYEPLFLECSYGFRPGRGCQDALKALQRHLYSKPTGIVIDVDLAQFFDTISHQALEKMLRKKLKDEKLMRYLIRMFKAGVLAAGELRVSEEGVAQGSCCSPVLANIFAHYVIDEWFADVVKPRCKGTTELFRYADDIVICCQTYKDAVRVKEALKRRLEKFGLRMNEEKTKFISFSRQQASQGERQGTFDFLGFTIYLGKLESGRMVPKLKTSSKRMRSKLKKFKEWIKSVRTWEEAAIWKRYKMKLDGHIQYFGVTFNSEGIKRFYYETLMLMCKWLNRRSQRRSYTEGALWNRVMNVYPQPVLRIYWSLF
jgi:RNA-directed DNA polymerase